MNVDIGMVGAGLAVGTLVGMTGMGAGSLMTPILISVFGIPATTAVGTDLVYSAITKTFGAARHHALRTVNTQLAVWMATGSVPAAVLGVYTLSRIADARGEAAVNAHLETAIGFALVLVGITVAVRTLVTVRRRSGPARTTDGELTRRHKVIAVAIGVVFGFILGLTSVGSGVFFGMALLTLFPLATRRVVGTDLFHAAMITVAAGAAQVIWGHPNFGYVGSILLGSIPGILLGSQLTVTIPEKALRGSIAGVLSVAGFKLIGAF